MKTKKFINANIYRNPEAKEILVEGGKFKAIGNNLPDADEVIDLKGKLVLPPYVDPHLHLDYTYTLSRMAEVGAESGTLFEAIENWPKYKATMTHESVKELAKKGIYDEVSQGVQIIRAQTDVTDPKFIGFKAIMELKEEMKDIVDIQVVAFPQNGMYTYKGGVDLVEEAVKMGADVVGGIPHYEPAREFGEKSMHDAVRIAMKYDKLIDIHCDETDDELARFVEILNALVYLEDYGTRTTASHTCSFGSANDSYAYRMFDMFKRSKMNFLSMPTENAYLQGRQDTYPKRRGLTRVKEFMQMGINVAFAQDSINDPWYPLGSGNMMNILDNGIHLTQYASPEELENAFDLITFNGAKAMCIEDYGVKEGNTANFIVLEGTNVFDAIRCRVNTCMSVRNGEFLYKKKPAEYEVEFKM